ncbi:toxin-antitoxin system YwqK family antitoxin [Shewanella cutis]|uniref:Uncharacterized protein n=1 Tax=Shewanella cutis TaxID=2766780 RepID=A0ABS9R2I6_9GAMM|nr:toxin-antitoxin system YwqK family antitoxin [Shewanella sp. PS-2]MCG9966240.1 hypothetical protein [Shewanella sp. PS-2]
MRTVLSLWPLLLSFNLSAEQLLFGGDWQLTDNRDEAIYYQQQASIKKGGVWAVELFYLETGKLVFRGSLNAADVSKGVVVGDFEFFHPNGQLSSKGSADNKGRYQGRYLRYETDGSLLQESHFKDNMIDGEQKIFHVNGKLKERYHMSYGVRLGLWQSYFENGQLEEQVNYGANGMEGLYESFYHDGKPKESVMMKAGKREGEYNYWSPEGKLQSKISYLEDMLHGEWVTYRDNGTLQVIRRYQHNKLAGTQQYFNDDGKLNGETTYDDRGREIRSVSYNAKGDVIAQTDTQYLSKGVISTTKEFTSTGKVIYLRQKDSVKDWELIQEFNSDGKLKFREETKNKLYEGLRVTGDGHGIKYINYSNGKKQGYYKENDYDEKGKGFVVGQYHLDNKVGEWVTQRYGRTKTEKFNQQGQLHGEQKEVTDDGTITYQAFYKNGVMHGAYLKIDFNKRTENKGQYVNGLREGPWLTRNTNSSIYKLWHGNYKNGRKIGRWECFSLNGHLLGLEWFDAKGNSQGKSYSFHEDGALISTHEYLDGRSETLFYSDGRVCKSNCIPIINK